MLRYLYIGGKNFDIDCLLDGSEEFKKKQAKEDKINSYERNSYSSNERKKNPVSIQFLIAHYLGITNALPIDNDPKARLLQCLFDAEDISTIKKYVSSEDKSIDPFSITNLEKVHSIFEEAGLIKQCQQIHADILALNNYTL